MVRTRSLPRPLKRGLILVAAIAITGAALITALSLLTGHGLHLRSFVRSLPELIAAVTQRGAVVAGTRGDYRNIVFLHHSVGGNLINQGGVRETFAAAGYQFWDHDYNYLGLRDPQAKYTGYSYRVPSDNTDPDGLLAIFQQPVYELPVNTLSGLLQHEVIIFKSCYPASDIVSDEQLRQRQDWYLQMRAVMDQHPDKIFVALTPPPLNPAETRADIAARARAFADWLASDAYTAGHPNVFVFDLFGALAEDDPAAPDFNMLRAAYRDGPDSHPNRAANEAIGPQLAAFVIASIEHYRASR